MANRLVEVEVELLKEFSKSLSADERRIFKQYQSMFVHSPFFPTQNNETERRKINLICMAFLEGVRFGRKYPNENNDKEINEGTQRTKTNLDCTF